VLQDFQGGQEWLAKVMVVSSFLLGAISIVQHTNTVRLSKKTVLHNTSAFSANDVMMGVSQS
jgi:hypothetical protein